MSSLEGTNNHSFSPTSINSNTEKTAHQSKNDKSTKLKGKIKAKNPESPRPITASNSSSSEASSSSAENPSVTHLCSHKHSSTDTTLDDETIRFFQGTLANMRRHVPELCQEGIDMYDVQTFVTSIYHGQISAVATIAQKNLAERGMESPVGDKWCILGLGSLGRGDVNPYSDLDFAILIETNDSTTRKYFFTLVTEMANIVEDFRDKGMHICKGQVAPRYMGMDEQGDKKKMGSKDLIGTPTTLVKNAMKKIMDPSKAETGMNAYSLMQVAYIHGDRKQAHMFMQTQKRSIKRRLKNRKAMHHFPDVDTTR